MKIIRLVAAIGVALLASLAGFAAQAQSTSVVILPGGCGTASYPQGSGYLTIDSTGHLCTNASSSGAATIANGADVAEGSTTDTPATTPTSATAATAIALQKAIANAVSSAIPVGTNIIGFTSNDPCTSQLKTNFAIGGAGGNIQVVAGSAAKKVYICSISLIAASTAVVNVIEGTGSACITANEAAIIGSTTAASGMSLAANGGLTLGNGSGTIGVTATAANGICILQSGTTALAGNVTYVQQ